jgi:N-acetylmuramoyl-L-alanine amidase
VLAFSAPQFVTLAPLHERVMSVRLGLVVAVMVGAITLAPAASPQTIAATSAVSRPMTGPTVVVMPLDQPAPIQRAILLKSPPLHSALSLDRRVADAGADVSDLDAEVACMAKAIHHEAANQPLKGQLALAQLIMNRLKSPLFPKSICAVVNQAGQFFHTARYHPLASDERWHVAVGVARIAREEGDAALAPGALFYQASSARPHWSHHHVEVARIGQHVFYR